MTSEQPVAESQIEDWRNILWREWSHCDDVDYARRLYEGCGPFSSANPIILFSQRPYAHQVERALYTACTVQLGAKYVWEKRLRRLEGAKRKATPLKKLIANLEDHHWFARFIARHVLVYRGGEAIDPLLMLAPDAPSNLYETIIWLIESICAETTARLAQALNEWLCPDCLIRCGIHWIDRPRQPDLSFYGCRFCSRSRDLLSIPLGNVVARLETDWMDLHKQDENRLYGNWLGRRELFDFDTVEIVQATDEEVERFAVQVGNDTDSFRKPRYEEMHCIIKCELSENTLRILESIFGQVEQMRVSE